MVEPREVLAGKGVDQINLYKLLRYLKESKLARKVEGYVIHTEQQTSVSAATSGKPTTASLEPHANPTAPTLQHITAFLEALTNPSREGQFFYNAPPSGNANEASLKYMLLDPTHHFRTIVSEARAVILAGGTMSPISDYTTHLLSYCPPSQVTTLSCGHVMPQGNLLAWVLSTGPTGKKFEFTYSKRAGREGEEMVDELGKALLNICGIVPDGVVVFFPSYAYLDSVVHRWQLPGSGTTSSLWGRLGSKKSLFREGKDSKSGSGEDILGEYSRAIGEGKGGLLLSVVGGKMSEGINFSDRLGRCVVIVGLPFPNIQSAEWKAKLAYIESVTMERLGDLGDADASTQAKPQNERVVRGLAETEKRALAKQAARDFYENACMRAVNQSVGRAIRHASDYAAIVMIDARFGSERIREKLSGWIREAVVVGKEERGFVELMGGLGRFFREKRE
jgi:chromosome transmission fidelity protein 1